jgi:small subunit ribosomal protein S6
MSNHYETVIIFSPLLSDDDVKREVSKYTKMVTDAGCTILEERLWGLRQLAYPIAGKSNGIYYITEYEGEGTIVQTRVEFKRAKT